jgi:transcription elongation factor SPT5
LIIVRISQLQESAEVASGQDKLAGYELHDLVVLSGGGSTNEVGVIVRVGREEFTVINNHGISREVRPEELRGKRNSSSGRAVALDVQGNQIRVGDTVTVAEGPHKGKNATIKRMNRAQLFLYSQTRTENAGIFVVRSRSCVLSGNKVQSGPSENGQNPFSTPQQGGAANGRGRGRQDDGLIGKTVRIQAGNWKGYLGGVSDATPTHVQVELHSRQKKVMVLREKVAVAGDKFGATEDPNRAVNNMLAPTTPFMGGATPMHGGATPMHGGATPMHGSATPMHGESMGGGFTPSHNGGGDDVWRPGGSIDRPEDDMDNSNDVGSTWAPTTNDSNQDNGFSASSSGNDGGWGASNEQSGSTWTPSTNENGNSNESTTQMKIPKEEPGYGISGASTMGAADDGQQAPVWFMERVCIQLKRSEKTAVIKDITHNNAVVELEDKSSQTVSFGDCTMVSPKEHDTVLVTGGADVGVEGELVCIDGTDAILRDPNGDFKIVDLVHLAKIVSES